MTNTRQTPPVYLEAELIADVAADSRLPGTRGGWMSRHLLFRSARLYIDMQLQHRPGLGGLSLTGQLLESGATPRALSGLQVGLEQASRSVSSATTDESGQFLLDCSQDGPATLAISLGSGVQVELPLPAVHPIRGEKRA